MSDDEITIPVLLDENGEESSQTDTFFVESPSGHTLLFPFGAAVYAAETGAELITVDPEGGVWLLKDGDWKQAGVKAKANLSSVK